MWLLCRSEKIIGALLNYKTKISSFLYNYLLELEIPQTSQELASALVNERLQREKQAIEMQRSSGGAIYFPKDRYAQGQKLIFPALNWRRGEVSRSAPVITLKSDRSK